MRRAREIACQPRRRVILGVVSRKTNPPRQRAAELQGGRAALHQLITEIVAGQHFLVWARLDHIVDPRVPARREGGGVRHRRQRLSVQSVTVRERLGDGTGLEVRGRAGKILAARDGNGAEPVFIGGRAVGAVAHERVALARRCVARDLGEGLLKVGVCRSGVAVVEVGELCRVAKIWVARDRVGDLVAEGQIDNEGTVAMVFPDVSMLPVVMVRRAFLLDFVRKLVALNTRAPRLGPACLEVKWPPSTLSCARIPKYSALELRPVKKNCCFGKFPGPLLVMPVRTRVGSFVAAICA